MRLDLPRCQDALACVAHRVVLLSPDYLDRRVNSSGLNRALYVAYRAFVPWKPLTQEPTVWIQESCNHSRQRTVCTRGTAVRRHISEPPCGSARRIGRLEHALLN